MIHANDIAKRDQDRQRIAADMAAYEAKHGPVETMAAGYYDRSGNIISANSDGTAAREFGRMSEARKKMIAERNGK